MKSLLERICQDRTIDDLTLQELYIVELAVELTNLSAEIEAIENKLSINTDGKSNS